VKSVLRSRSSSIHKFQYLCGTTRILLSLAKEARSIHLQKNNYQKLSI